MVNTKFINWIDKTVDSKDEFLYRYIYDAYMTVKNGESLYYTMIGNKMVDQVTKDVELEFESEKEKQDFLNYLICRFCGENYANMKDWHDTRSRWHWDDMNNWEKL